MWPVRSPGYSLRPKNSLTACAYEAPTAITSTKTPKPVQIAIFAPFDRPGPCTSRTFANGTST